MTRVSAWLLAVANGRFAAIGERELNHLIHEPRIYSVPQTPEHCRNVVAWEDRVLPLWNVNAWLDSSDDLPEVPVVAVIAYQRARRDSVRFGAIALVKPPVRVQVSDDQVCDLPVDAPAWHDIAISCFTHDGRSVPILDLRRMFSGEVRRAAAQPLVVETPELVEA